MTTLTMQDDKRLDIIQRVYQSELTMGEGTGDGVSERQCYRVEGRVDKDGAKGRVHGNRGCVCKRKTNIGTTSNLV